MGDLKIRRLEITDFMAHTRLVLRFEQAITYIRGPHGSGKSSALDALRVLLRGTARGLTKQDRKLLARGATFSLRADGVVGDQGLILQATPTQETPSPTARQQQIGAPQTLRVLLDTEEWQYLSADDRRRLLNDLIGTQGWGGKPLPAEIEATRRSKGAKAALTAATESRRRYQGLLEDPHTAPKPPQDIVQVEGKEYNLANIDKMGVSAKIKTARERGNKLRGDLTEAETSREQIEKLMQEAIAEAKAVPELEAGLAKLEASKKLHDAAGANAAAKSNTARRDADLENAEAKRLETMLRDATCATCGQAIADDYRADAQARMTSAIKKKNALMVEHKEAQELWQQEANASNKVAGEIQDQKARLKRARDAAQEAETARVTLDTLPAQKSDPVKLRAEIDAAAAEQDHLTSLYLELGKREQAIVTMHEAQKAHAGWQKMKEMYAESEKALQDSIASGASDSLALMARSVGDFVSPLGWAITWDDELMPKKDSMPFGLCCKSDQYILLLAIQVGLAHLSGIRFIISDDHDRLTNLRRKAVRTMLARASQDGLQAILAIASDEEGAFNQAPFQVIPLEAKALDHQNE